MSSNKSNGHGLTNIIDELFNTSFQDIVGASIQGGRPAANISKVEQGYVVELAAPGYEKADFAIEIKEDYLTISSEKVDENATEDQVRAEFSHGSFSRSFRLSDDIDREKVEATYTDGILKVSLQLLEEQVANTSLTIPVG